MSKLFIGLALVCLGCGVSPEEVAELRTEVGELRTTVERLSTEAAATAEFMACQSLQQEAMQAWSRHRPSWGRCTQVGRTCRETGLRPNTISPYRRRLTNLFNLINAADYERAARALDRLRFPVPTAEAWYDRQSFTQAEYTTARDHADALTRRFLVECGGVSSAAEPQGEEESTEEESTESEGG